MNSTSKLMVTSSPTRIPPVSSAVFHVRPKSLRLIFVVADTATRVLPQGSFVGGVGPSTEKSTLRVTPRMVRSPSTASSPSRTRLMRVDFKDSVGKLALHVGDHHVLDLEFGNGVSRVNIPGCGCGRGLRCSQCAHGGYPLCL